MITQPCQEVLSLKGQKNPLEQKQKVLTRNPPLPGGDQLFVGPTDLQHHHEYLRHTELLQQNRP